MRIQATDGHRQTTLPPWKKAMAGQAVAAASRAVANALAVEFPQEPLVSAELSRILSVTSSVAKRHGPLIESAMAEALDATGRLVVLRNIKLPISEAARSLVASGRVDQVAHLSLNLEDSGVDQIDVDLIVIDEANHWAAAVQCKRGNGATEPGKRKRIENGLMAAEMTLSSYLRQRGYASIDVAVTAIIDFYGNGSFRKDLTLTREDLDDFFAVDVVSNVERMTSAIRDALDEALPALIAPLIARARSNVTATFRAEGAVSQVEHVPEISRLQRKKRPVGHLPKHVRRDESHIEGLEQARIDSVRAGRRQGELAEGPDVQYPQIRDIDFRADSELLGVNGVRDWAAARIRQRHLKAGVTRRTDGFPSASTR